MEPTGAGSGADGPTISPSGVRCTPLMPGISTTSAQGTAATRAAATRVAENPAEADSGPTTAKPTGMITRDTSQS